MNTSIKKLKLATSNNIDGATHLLSIVLLQMKSNYQQIILGFYKIMNNYLEPRNSIKKLNWQNLRFADTTNSVCSDLKHEKLIYISTRIINPGKIYHFI